MVSNRTILSQEQNRARLRTAALGNAANLAVSQFFNSEAVTCQVPGSA